VDVRIQKLILINRGNMFDTCEDYLQMAQWFIKDGTYTPEAVRDECVYKWTPHYCEVNEDINCDDVARMYWESFEYVIKAAKNPKSFLWKAVAKIKYRKEAETDMDESVFPFFPLPKSAIVEYEMIENSPIGEIVKDKDGKLFVLVSKDLAEIIFEQTKYVLDAEDRDESERMTRVEAELLAEKMTDLLEPYCEFVEICGSYRRGREDPGDLDIVIIPKEGETLPEIVGKLTGYYEKYNWIGEKKTQLLVDGVKVDIKVSSLTGLGAALLYFTGPAGYNIGMRRSAKSKGMKLNEYGIWDRDTNEYLGGATEEEIYAVLGKTFRPPEERGAESFSAESSNSTIETYISAICDSDYDENCLWNWGHRGGTVYDGPLFCPRCGSRIEWEVYDVNKNPDEDVISKGHTAESFAAEHTFSKRYNYIVEMRSSRGDLMWSSPCPDYDYLVKEISHMLKTPYYAIDVFTIEYGRKIHMATIKYSKVESGPMAKQLAESLGMDSYAAEDEKERRWTDSELFAEWLKDEDMVFHQLTARMFYGPNFGAFKDIAKRRAGTTRRLLKIENFHIFETIVPEIMESDLYTFEMKADEGLEAMGQEIAEYLLEYIKKAANDLLIGDWLDEDMTVAVDLSDNVDEDEIYLIFPDNSDMKLILYQKEMGLIYEPEQEAAVLEWKTGLKVVEVGGVAFS